ncbi:hypothetical protein [Eisenibacter elegans]|uniref:hypothetical protein n=1 Tax=Eisenibacter elegans TaxID=997 RepID=UPI00040C813A|nr:hypothetical protein [Eisenibacter elegans]
MGFSFMTEEGFENKKKRFAGASYIITITSTDNQYKSEEVFIWGHNQARRKGISNELKEANFDTLSNVEKARLLAKMKLWLDVQYHYEVALVATPGNQALKGEYNQFLTNYFELK